jgi:predicted amidohydrolase
MIRDRLTRDLTMTLWQTVRVAGAQIPVSASVSSNVAAILRGIDYASASGAAVLLTPEGSVSGYTVDFDHRATREAVSELVDQAGKRELALALGTCYLEEDGRRYDEIRFYGRSGRFLGFHAKILLSKNVRDSQAKSELDEFATKPLEIVHFEGTPVGGLVCNDLWANPECTPMDDPHLTQHLVRLGARVVFHAVNTQQSDGEELRLRRAFHETNLRIRARAAGIWIITTDAADPAARLASSAPSGVLSPEGRWVVKAPMHGEAFFCANISVPNEAS